MKSEWKVASQYFGEKIYQVYRLIDIKEIDHSGNREYIRAIFTNRSDAVMCARELNEKE